jgi:hypothetical protein
MQNLADCLTETARLARERSYAQDNTNQINVTNINETAHWMKGRPIERQRYQKTQDNLVNYLHSLDYTIIKDILAIMYLGRDKIYSESDTCEEKLLAAQKNADKKGLKMKQEMIEKIAQKSDLDIYLLDGMKILNMNVPDIPV